VEDDGIKMNLIAQPLLEIRTGAYIDWIADKLKDG